MKKNFFFGLCFLLVGLNAVSLFLVYRQTNRLTDLQKRYSHQLQLESQDFSPILLAFPDEQKVIEFVSAVNFAQSLFENLSLNFKSDVPLNGKKQPYLPLVLIISGPTKQVLEFTHQLLNSPFILEITDLEAKSKDNFVNQTELIIKANLYVAENF